MATKISDIEQEIIILKAIIEIIDSMVTYEIMSLVGDEPDSNILFKSSIHQKFFNIVLVDFLSPIKIKGLIDQESYLSAMKDISERPSFNVGDSIRPLHEATQKFIDWLDQEVKVDDVWLPSIDKQTTLCIARKNFLKMCGNISKHNFLRLSVVARGLQKSLAANGVSVAPEDSLLMLTDFYERFHTDIMTYHSSTIAEFLNNIRWGIYEYMQPEFHRSIVLCNISFKSYNMPYL
jgi:hypothetical protein